MLSVSLVSAAQTSHAAPRYDREMVSALATSLGVSEDAAAARLDSQGAQHKALKMLVGKGVATDGAFFRADGKLTVNAGDAKAAKAIEEAGLTARVAQRGQAALDRIKADLDARAVKQAPIGVVAWSVDLSSDTVTVEVNNDSSAAARSFIKAAKAHGDAVRIVTGKAEVEPKAVVPPGSKMTFDGMYCSVGFGAHDASGKQYLVTAGHCVEFLEDLYYNGSHFAKGTNTRYVYGQPSVDMGIAAVDADDSIGMSVNTYGQGGSPVVQGSTRAVPGASLCKAGATTGWTCGKVNSYNATVNYPSTVVTGLASSSVCVESGDSGGAYISGNQAQGMTSGGPKNQKCNRGVYSSGSSYFQPLDDALSHYGLTLNAA